MSKAVLIISAAADFGSELGVALARRGACRVALVGDGAAALPLLPQDLVLLDSSEEAASRVLAQQLQQAQPDLAIHHMPQGASVGTALTQWQPPATSEEATPLEPLAGDESDASSWHYIQEPAFLREYVPATLAAAPGLGEAQPGQPAALEETVTASATVDEDPTTAGLAQLRQETDALIALLTREGQPCARAGRLDERIEADLRALGAEGAGSQDAVRLLLVDDPALPEACLLYVCDAGALQLSVLVPDDRSVRALRGACDRFLQSLN